MIMTSSSSALARAASARRALLPATARRVAVAEEYRVGGTCVIRGCVPKKLLVYGAHFAEDLEDARRFGWSTDGAISTGRRCATMWRLKSTGSKGFTGRRLIATRSRCFANAPPSPGPTGSRWPAGEGHGRNILIATGAWPRCRISRVRNSASRRMKSSIWPTLPKRAVIAGAGYIANEFAGIFNELGVEVTLVNARRQDAAQL